MSSAGFAAARKAMERVQEKDINDSVDLNEERLAEWLGIAPGTSKNKMREATYFACMKLLNETLAKMPIQIYQYTPDGVKKAEANDVYRLLKYRPNEIMTPTTFWSAVENNRNHFGNAYVWIRRETKRLKYGAETKIKDLWVMPSNDVTVIIDDKGVFGNAGKMYYWYSDKYGGGNYLFKQDEVMNFRTSTTFDGITGASVREILKTTIEGGLESQEFMNGLYKGGMTARAALQYTGDLSPKLERELIKKFESYASGANNAGKFIPVPIGMKIQPLDIKLTDSQFFELKKYTALQIAAAFGIKPNQINDYEKSSYSNSESQQLSFYVDTMLYILKQYEEEINYKLLMPSEREAGIYLKFNADVILRTDAKTQAEILTKYVQNGIKTANEAREKLDMTKAPGGDELMCNGNFIKLVDLGINYKNKEKGGGK